MERKVVTPEAKAASQIWKFRKGDLITYALLMLVWLVWGITYTDFLSVCKNYWYFIPFGILAATVAMSTPGGGGIVFFPIMVRVGVPSVEVVAFSFAAQSVGMSFGSIRWMIEDFKSIQWKVIFSTVPGGWLGLYLGTLYLPIEQGKTARYIYSVVGLLLGLLTLYIYNKRREEEDIHATRLTHHATFFIMGIFGGLVTSFIGIGINLCIFFFMVLVLRHTIKNSAVTSILIIALISLLGFFLHSFCFRSVRWEFFQMVIPGILTGAIIGPKLLLTIGSRRMMYMLVTLLFLEFIATIFFGRR